MNIFCCFASKASVPEQQESLIERRKKEALNSGVQIRSQVDGDIAALQKAGRVGGNAIKQQDHAAQTEESTYSGKYLWAAIGLAVVAVALAAVATAIILVPLLAGMAAIGVAAGAGALALGALGGAGFCGYKHYAEKA